MRLTPQVALDALTAASLELADQITALKTINRMTEPGCHPGSPLDHRHILERLMATAAELQAAVDDLNATADSAIASQNAAVARVAEDVATLRTTIDELNVKLAELQALVDAGGATPAIMEAIAATKVKLTALLAGTDGLDPTSPVILPTPTP